MGREWRAPQAPVSGGISIESSLKRIAWAYGCAKKDSDEESMLWGLLIDKVMSLRDEPADAAERGRQHAAAAVDALLGVKR